jgi:hypothetical protein
VPTAFDLAGHQVTPAGVAVATLRRKGKPEFRAVAPQP